MKSSVPPTLLLVEDNADDVFLMKRVLKKAGISLPLQVVTDGRQALEYLEGAGDYQDRDLHPIPGLVFLDLKLPYMRGFEILAWMRAQPALAPLPVVILTSSAEERDLAHAQNLNVPYWVKPPTPEAVKDLVENLLR